MEAPSLLGQAVSHNKHEQQQDSSTLLSNTLWLDVFLVECCLSPSDALLTLGTIAKHLNAHFCGDDSMTLPLMSIGGSGVISVAGNLIPKDVISLVKSFNNGDIAKAQEWHHKRFPLCRDMLGLSTNPIPVKVAMGLIGMDCGPLRLPMTPLSDAEMDSLRATLKAYGLL